MTSKGQRCKKCVSGITCEATWLFFVDKGSSNHGTLADVETRPNTSMLAFVRARESLHLQSNGSFIALRASIPWGSGVQMTTRISGLITLMPARFLGRDKQRLCFVSDLLVQSPPRSKKLNSPGHTDASYSSKFLRLTEATTISQQTQHGKRSQGLSEGTGRWDFQSHVACWEASCRFSLFCSVGGLCISRGP